MHPGRIHGYVRRKHREREQRENDTIIIPVILCLVARAQNTQYTKRLLPQFLIPHSVIRLDNLVEAAELAETGRSEAAACELIGCLDPRTARRQLRRFAAAIEEVSLALTLRRAATPELGEAPQISPGTPPAKRLTMLFDSEIRAGERAGNTSALPALRQLLQAALWKKRRNKPSSSASAADRPP